jgi:hypothetical protein
MAKKKIIKRIFIGLGIFLVLFIGALVAIPFLFKDEIIEGVKKVANENLNAKLDFSTVDISLLRSFPSVSIGLNDYSVTGIEEFEGVKLVGGDAFRITVDFWSAWNFGKVPLEIKSVTLDKPEINVIVLANGRANYDIAKPTTDTTTTETAFQIKLQEYAITEGNITYDDRMGGTYLKLTDLNHSGEGDFTQDIFDLNTKTSIGEMTAESGGIAYLKKAKMKLDAGFNIDMPNSKYTLKENDLRINDLQLKADGWLAMPNENDIDMDLRFSAPQSDFKSFLSMIPNAYTAGYDNVKASGTFKLDGLVKGKYSDKPETYPAFNINLDINNGDVKYPDLPLGISAINTNVKVNSPGTNLDQMLVDISKFSLKIGNNPLEGYFKLRTPMSDPDVDTKIKGVLNLEELSKAFPMEGVKTLNGIINSDIAVKTKMSTIDKGDYANVDMTGNASIQNMNYVADGMPAVNISAMQVDFTPQSVNLPSFTMKLGKSDLSGSGRIDNLLAYFSPDKTMKGSMTVRSNYFNADEWMTEEEVDSGQSAVGSPPPASTDEEIFNRFDFTMDAQVAKMDYDVYKIENFVAKGNFTPAKLTVTQLSGKLGDSDFNASGALTNIWNYLFSNEKLGGNLTLRSNYMNLNQFMTEEGAPATSTSPAEASEPILVPENIDMIVNADMNTVIYDNMELKNVRGALLVRNEEVRFDNLTANSLGGNMKIDGGYNTQVHDKPKFDFGMKLTNIDFQKAFNTFNTFQAIAPIGKYIQGNFNTDLTMSSNLTKDLMPDLGTLAAAGLLETLNGTITGAAPLQAIGDKLNVDAFKKLNIKNSKNWFTVKDGAVQLEEFKQSYDGIDMRIGGSHKLTGDMDYKIIAKIPRAKIGKNPLGAAANSGLDFLSGEASKLGLNVNAGEYINVQINLGGTLDKPKPTFKILGSEGTGESVKDAVVSKVKEEAQQQLDKAKDEATARAEAERKKLEAAAHAEKERLEAELKKKAEEEAKKAAEAAAKKVGGDAAKKAEEEAKKKLEEINPFKKKKGGGGG